MNWADVRKIGLRLSDVEEGTAYGAPALKVRGELLACIPVNKSVEADSLAVRIDFEQRDIGGDGFAMAGVQIVQHRDRRAAVAQRRHDVTADETGPAGDQKPPRGNTLRH